MAFVEQRGWVIVDYKTDRIAVGAVPGLAEHYAPQVRRYAKIGDDLTGQEVQEMGLFSRIQAVMFNFHEFSRQAVNIVISVFVFVQEYCGERFGAA